MDRLNTTSLASLCCRLYKGAGCTFLHTIIQPIPYPIEPISWESFILVCGCNTCVQNHRLEWHCHLLNQHL
ncbi:hypothetical protein I7I50_04543 [Histoplasma capsulatum G186AR]|uniref:Uncharacterized protein n=1 Tax=Ajellomyces capsulatus TaxID=5037 RepID=A0A8H7YPQ4_AJECA|nr:hypothetical protein I7I52_05452 [Histoplasma capsulatum]QSS75415.1 hypothetical protein I7I50_04543 [Histoplasma capsulatum G186AR]